MRNIKVDQRLKPSGSTPKAYSPEVDPPWRIMGYCFVDLSHQPVDLLPAGRRELFKDLIRQWPDPVFDG